MVGDKITIWWLGNQQVGKVVVGVKSHQLHGVRLWFEVRTPAAHPSTVPSMCYIPDGIWWVVIVCGQMYPYCSRLLAASIISHCWLLLIRSVYSQYGFLLQLFAAYINIYLLSILLANAGFNLLYLIVGSPGDCCWFLLVSGCCFFGGGNIGGQMANKYFHGVAIRGWLKPRVRSYCPLLKHRWNC